METMINGMPINIIAFVAGIIVGMLFEVAIAIMTKWIEGEE